MENSEFPINEIYDIKYIAFQDMLKKHGTGILNDWYSFATDSSYFIYRNKNGEITLGVLLSEYESFLKTIR